MADELEAPQSADELYHGRRDETTDARPRLTGDVLQDLSIPGLDDSASEAIILAHPCEMRRGAILEPRILVARVKQFQRIPFDKWLTGHYSRMPLPELRGQGTHAAAQFDLIGLVSSDVIEGVERIACLSRRGINLLQQRFVWYLTRFAVPTHQLDVVSAPVFDEVELAEEWIEADLDRGIAASVSFAEFDAWLTSDEGTGASRRDRLVNPQDRSYVRRQLRDEIARRSERRP